MEGSNGLHETGGVDSTVDMTMRLMRLLGLPKFLDASDVRTPEKARVELSLIFNM